jgi:hypothetical protein
MQIFPSATLFVVLSVPRKIMKNSKTPVDELIAFHRDCSLTKKGTPRKQRDFCIMVPYDLVNAAMKLSGVEDVITKNNSILARGLKWRYDCASKPSDKGRAVDMLLNMQQLDLLITTVRGDVR